MKRENINPLKKETILLESHYLPCLEYFLEISRVKNILLEVNENYQKQSYRNRAAILTANKTLVLSVPVVNNHKKTLMKDVLIDYSESWAKAHWRSIQSAYGKAPFFEFYEDYFYKVFMKKHDFLIDLNMDFLTTVLQLLGLQKSITFTEVYNREQRSDVRDLRSMIHPKKRASENFLEKKIRYRQVFGEGFADNLSIIDLLCCEGNNSLNVLTSANGLMNK